MNILGFVLPGLREVRTPLVAGWLWMSLLYLLTAVTPGGAFDVPDRLRPPSWFDQLGAGGRVAILSICAYFVGLAARPVQRLLLAALHRVVRVVVVALILGLLVWSAPLMAKALLWAAGVILLLSAAVLLVLVVRDRTAPLGAFARGIEHLVMEQIAAFGESKLRGIAQRYGRVSTGDYRGIRRDVRFFLAERIDRTILAEPGTMRRFVEGMRLETLTLVAGRLLDHLGMDRRIEYGQAPAVRELTGEMINKAIVAMRYDDTARPVVVEFVLQALQSSRSNRLDVYLTLIDLRPWEAAVLQDLDSLSAELQVRASDLYQQWDRQTSEAEFRTACAVPIALISLTFLVWTFAHHGTILTWSSTPSHWINWHVLTETVSRAPLNVVFGVVVVVVSVLIYRSGLAAHRSADVLLMTAVRRGVVEPSAGTMPTAIKDLVLMNSSFRFPRPTRDGATPRVAEPSRVWRLTAGIARLRQELAARRRPRRRAGTHQGVAPPMRIVIRGRVGRDNARSRQ